MGPLPLGPWPLALDHAPPPLMKGQATPYFQESGAGAPPFEGRREGPPHPPSEARWEAPLEER